MHRDAHYYAMLAFCRACGFKKESAHVIAYASQFVDDAKIDLIYFQAVKNKAVRYSPTGTRIKTAKLENEFHHDRIQGRPAFFNMATCHSYFRIKTFNYEAMVNNTCAFHFVPGCEGENFSKKMRCKEESPVILALLNEALTEDNLIKFGIVLHVYADTFSHQGFSGVLSKVNDIKACKPQSEIPLDLCERFSNFLRQFSQDEFERFLDKLTPAYGHAQAVDLPDTPYLTWTYEYDYTDEFQGSFKKVEINNKERYQRAFRGIQKYLALYLKKHPHHKDLKQKSANVDPLMKALIYEAGDKRREKHWQKVLVAEGLFSRDDQRFLQYDETRWLKDAFQNYDEKTFNQRVVDGAILTENFAQSYWYGFYRAVHWYKRRFFTICSGYGLTIPN